jgi:hypothetical protein
MCCFTEEVEKVSNTQIFARALDDTRQLIVYAMTFAAKTELAMVLPIPTPPGAAEDAVRFLPLDECPDFFEQMGRGFPARYVSGGDTIGALSSDVEEETTLAVHEVGSYEASFVPRPEDFARLDERFRLPVDIWLELNTYRDWGFAVFKLKPTATPAEVHPMAFEFQRRDRKRLFFPTLHLHGPKLEADAEFDHSLYCQPEPAMNWHLQGWEDSRAAAAEFVECAQARRLVDGKAACWRLVLEGTLPNTDTWLGAS